MHGFATLLGQLDPGIAAMTSDIRPPCALAAWVREPQATVALSSNHLVQLQVRYREAGASGQL